MQMPMTPRDMLDLGYSPEWVALSIRIATQMQMKARQLFLKEFGESVVTRFHNWNEDIKNRLTKELWDD